MDLAKLESFIVEVMSKTRIPGLSIALVKGADVVYARGFGFRDVERGLAATPRTVYGIGSVTKSFTALAIMKLVEEGKLSLDDPIDKFVDVDLRPFGEPVTIHHLLTHSSGIPALAYAEAFIRGALELDTSWLPLATPEDLVAFMRGASSWAVAKPGEKFFYLNEGYVLLGLVVSKLSGMKYEDFVREKILKPLGMSRTYFFKEEVDRDPDVATPYIIARDGRLIPSRFPYGLTADGGLLSNAMDMARYVAMYISRGSLDGVEVASRESIEAMEKSYVPIPYGYFGDDGYGYGLIVTNRFFDRKLVWHSGSVLVYTAFMGYLPQEKLGVVVLANASGYPPMFVGLYALTLALGYDPEKDLEFVKYDRILDKLCGVYEAYRGTYRLTVARKGSFLSLEYRDRYTEWSYILVPEEVREDYARFYTVSYGRKIPAEFFIDGDRVVMLFERYKMVKKVGMQRV